MYACVCVCVCVCVCCVCVYSCMCVCVYLCMHACVRACVCAWLRGHVNNKVVLCLVNWCKDISTKQQQKVRIQTPTHPLAHTNKHPMHAHTGKQVTSSPMLALSSALVPRRKMDSMTGREAQARDRTTLSTTMFSRCVGHWSAYAVWHSSHPATVCHVQQCWTCVESSYCCCCLRYLLLNKTENPPLLICILICRFPSSRSTSPSPVMHVVCVCMCVHTRACV